jgi:hypothetical protein
MVQVAPVTEIAQMMEARIKAGSLSQRDFTCERSYGNWELKLEEIDDALVLQEADKLFVHIVAHPSEQKINRITRGKETHSGPFDVCIRKKFGNNSNDLTTQRVKIEEVDSLILFVNEVRLLFVNHTLSGVVSATLDESQQEGGVAIVTLPDTEHLRDLRQFTAILRFHMRAEVQINAA